jgi:hypothetical protein
LTENPIFLIFKAIVMAARPPTNDENPPQSPFSKGGDYTSLYEREVGRD